MSHYRIKNIIFTASFARISLIVLAAGFLVSAHMAVSFADTASMAPHNYALTDSDSGITIELVLLNVSLRSGLKSGALEDQKFSDAPAMRRFYQERDNKPLWLEEALPEAKSVLHVLETSWTHGLNPEQYHVNEIRRLLDHPMQPAQAQMELLLSDAIIRYGRDMTGMRIEPDEIRQKAKYWRSPLLGFDILQAVSKADDPANTLEELAPKGKLYKKLRTALIDLVEEENNDNDDTILPISFDNRLLQLGDRHKNVPKLRTRLGVIHNPENGSKFRYDDPLGQAVMIFQKAHGLETDGIIGSKTLSLLNLTRENRIHQVVANLERLRWLEQKKPERYILVNIPSAMLWAVENDEIKIEMPVVVGLRYRPTKSFKTEITGIRFNPTWTVPLSIKMRDFLPKLQKDPSYLTDRRIELFHGYGKNRQTLDPQAIDWHNMSWKKMGKIRMVQTPGDHNALGRIRVLMQNPYNIYMHDTNHKEYFERTERNFSSGCIRLSRPKDVARFVMAKNEGWSDEEMETFIRNEDTIDIEAANSMPVYILYMTIWLDDSGRLVFGRDTYKQDRKLIEKLALKNELYSYYNHFHKKHGTIPPLFSSR